MPGATYTYDSLGRLREILFDDDSSIVFDLDDLGNRIAVYENPPSGLKAESSTKEQKKE